MKKTLLLALPLLFLSGCSLIGNNQVQNTGDSETISQLQQQISGLTVQLSGSNDENSITNIAETSALNSTSDQTGVPVGKNLSLSLSKGWAGTKITGIIDGAGTNQGKLYIPINFVVKNTSNDSLLLPTPEVLPEGGEVSKAPSFIISCYAKGSNLLDNSQGMFWYMPGMINASYITLHDTNSQLTTLFLVTKSMQWSENVASPLGYIEGKLGMANTGGPQASEEKIGWEPRFTLANEENVSGSLIYTCGLFVNTLAGSNICGCKHSDTNGNKADIVCFKKCYPELKEDNFDYYEVNNYNSPGKYWMKIDEQAMKFKYTGKAIGQCDFGCVREFSFQEE